MPNSTVIPIRNQPAIFSLFLNPLLLREAHDTAIRIHLFNTNYWPGPRLTVRLRVPGKLIHGFGAGTTA